MKHHLIIVLFSLFAIQCSKPVEKISANENENQNHKLSPINLPANTVDLSELQYDNSVSLWTLDGKRFSGYAESMYPDGTIKQLFGVFQGKKQNEANDWYPDGHLKFSANYHNGKLHGEKKAWTSGDSHILISHLNYYLGKAHGVQKKWYATGEIFKIMHLNMGKEEGIQQAYRKNGVLYANYEAKEGRIFGMKKAALCFELEDEKVVK